MNELKIDVNNLSLRRNLESKLRAAIIEGHFYPGEHLSDRKLTEAFGVSRAVVREATRILEAEGLVDIAPNKGAFVKKLSAEEAEKIYDVRCVLEALAAKNFATKASDVEITELEIVLKEFTEAAKKRDFGSLILIKSRFYDVLVKGAKNPYLDKMLNQVLNRNNQLRATTMSDPKRVPGTISELEDIVNAIKARDPDLAWEYSVFHVEQAARKAMSMLNSQL